MEELRGLHQKALPGGSSCCRCSCEGFWRRGNVFPNASEQSLHEGPPTLPRHSSKVVVDKSPVEGFLQADFDVDPSDPFGADNVFKQLKL